MNLLLHHKIVLGYIVLIVIIGISAAIVLNEHIRLNRLESKTIELQSIQRDIDIIHHRITTLATYGESVIIWSMTDYNKYHSFRKKSDSLLICLKQSCKEFICPKQIDTLRILLEQKETHLYDLMNVIQTQEKSDSVFFVQFPDVVKKSFGLQKISRRKKGLAGLLGRKEMVCLPHKPYGLLDLNDTLVSNHLFQNTQIEMYADSLRFQNKLLNLKLYELISSLDNRVQGIYLKRGNEMSSAYKESYRIFVFVVVTTVTLLIFSFLVIRLDLRKEENVKKKLKHAVCENEELLDMRNKVILTVSHDIKGPIGNIHNCADLASATLDPQKRENYLRDIRCSCRHILHLVNNLMDAYCINEARGMRNDLPFVLSDFLKRITDDFSRKANAKALLFYSIHHNSNPTLLGDVDKLEQVLSNLLTNAIKFTPSGSIHFQTDYRDGKLYVEVSDTGIGMDLDTQKRIFDPFERAAQNVNSEGFGLGLFLTKGLVKVLDGTLDLVSSLGNGTTFKLIFSFPETTVMIEDCVLIDSLSLRLPEKVLVIDDDQILLKVTEDMLNRNGVKCTVCTTAQELMSTLEESDYDLLLTDIQMPVMDGFSLLKLLRNSDIGNSKKIPVAAMTARGDGTSCVYEQSGFCGVLHKPFDIKELLSFLSSIHYQENTNNQMEFDFSILFGNTDERDYMLRLVIQESEKELEEFEMAMKVKDYKQIRYLLHRMIPAWEMLGKDSVLRDLQCLLHSNDFDDLTVSNFIFSVMEWIKKLIEESKRLLNDYENTNS